MQFKRLTILFATATLSLSQSIADLPTCAAAGAVAAISSTSCSTTDISCVCKSSTFTASLNQYAQANCSPADYNRAITVGSALCAQAGVAVSNAASVATGSSTADPAAAAATASTTPATGSTTWTADATAAIATVVTKTKCKCEEETVTLGVPTPVATYTGGAADKVVGGVGAAMMGVWGLVALV